MAESDNPGDDLIRYLVLWLRIAGRIAERHEEDFPPSMEFVRTVRDATAAVITEGRSNPPPIGFDPSPYREFYAEFMTLAADPDDDAVNNRCVAWYQLGLDEAGRVSDSLGKTKTRMGREIEAAVRIGRPVVNAERDEQIREWRYRKRIPVKTVVDLVKEHYGEKDGEKPFTPARVSQIAPPKYRESWILANPEKD